MDLEHLSMAVWIVVWGAAGCACCALNCSPEKNSAPSTPPAVPETARAVELAADITPEKAKGLLDENKGYVYLDVRTVAEFQAVHVPGSWNIPVMTLDANTGERELNAQFLSIVEKNLKKDARVIVGCRSGARSAKARDMMREAGFLHVTNMLGGLLGSGAEHPGWTSKGLPMESGDGGARSYRSLAAEAGP